MGERFWLVRHASTAWTGRRWCGSTDLPLSAAGRREASTLARAIADWTVPADGIWSSPSRRALQTARAIALATGLEVRVDDALREVDFGRAEGLTWAEISATLPELAECIATRSPFVDWPGGETSDELRVRSRRVRERLAAEPGSLIVLTHGGIARAILELTDATRTDLALVPTEIIEVRWEVTT